MAIEKSGNVSLTQIRGNVGLSGAGSMSERAVQNQINYTSGAPMTAFRGAINGTQRSFNSIRSNIVQTKTNWDLYADAFNFSSVSVNSSGTINTNCYVDPFGFSEGGAEFRLAGIVSPGTRRLVASASYSGGVIGTDVGAGFSQLSLIYSTGGWLVGQTEVLASGQGGNSGSYSLDSGTIYPTINIYACLIGYSIIYEGYGQENQYHNWNNAIMRLG